MKIYKGWWLSKNPLNKNELQAVKGNEKIIGQGEKQIMREIDRRALKEMRRTSNEY